MLRRLPRARRRWRLGDRGPREARQDGALRSRSASGSSRCIAPPCVLPFRGPSSLVRVPRVLKGNHDPVQPKLDRPWRQTGRIREVASCKLMRKGSKYLSLFLASGRPPGPRRVVPSFPSQRLIFPSAHFRPWRVSRAAGGGDRGASPMRDYTDEFPHDDRADDDSVGGDLLADAIVSPHRKCHKWPGQRALCRTPGRIDRAPRLLPHLSCPPACPSSGPGSGGRRGAADRPVDRLLSSNAGGTLCASKLDPLERASTAARRRCSQGSLTMRQGFGRCALILVVAQFCGEWANAADLLAGVKVAAWLSGHALRRAAGRALSDLLGRRADGRGLRRQ